MKHPGGTEVRGLWKNGKMIENNTEAKLDKEDPLQQKKARFVAQETVIRVVDGKGKGTSS